MTHTTREITASTIADEIGRTPAMVGVYRRRAEKKLGKTLGQKSAHDFRKTVYTEDEKAQILAEAPPRASDTALDAELVEGDEVVTMAGAGGRLALSRGTYNALAVERFDSADADLNLQTLDAYTSQGAALFNRHLIAVATAAFKQAEYNIQQTALAAEANAMQQGISSMGKPQEHPTAGQ